MGAWLAADAGHRPPHTLDSDAKPSALAQSAPTFTY
jgi:hypothetical protein